MCPALKIIRNGLIKSGFEMTKPVSRRGLFKRAVAVGAGFFLGKKALNAKQPKKEQPRQPVQTKRREQQKTARPTAARPATRPVRRPSRILPRREIERLIDQHSQFVPAGYPRELLIRQIFTETNRGDAHAYGSAGEIGLMQIKPSVLADLQRANMLPRRGITAEDLFDPAVNIQVGTSYIGWIWRYVRPMGKRENFTQATPDEQIDFVLGAYNQGIGRIERKGITPLAAEYIRRVRQTTRLPPLEAPTNQSAPATGSRPAPQTRPATRPAPSSGRLVQPRIASKTGANAPRKGFLKQERA